MALLAGHAVRPSTCLLRKARGSPASRTRPAQAFAGQGNWRQPAHAYNSVKRFVGKLRQLEEGYLPETRVMRCCTEDQAVECSAGLWIGGKKTVVIMQNQGFYASVNAIRAVGLDSRLPLVLMIGPWGREFANLGQDPRTSRRRVVAMLEPMLDTLGIRHWRMESAADLDNVGAAIDYAYGESMPAAVVVGAYTAWE